MTAYKRKILRIREKNSSSLSLSLGNTASCYLSVSFVQSLSEAGKHLDPSTNLSSWEPNEGLALTHTESSLTQSLSDQAALEGARALLWMGKMEASWEQYSAMSQSECVCVCTAKEDTECEHVLEGHVGATRSCVPVIHSQWGQWVCVTAVPTCVY